MDQDQLATALAETFEDVRMSGAERHDLRALLAGLGNDPAALAFARDRAFALVAEELARGPARPSEPLHWLEEVVRGIEAARGPCPCHSASAHFSPGHHCANQILWLTRAVRASLDVCVFAIADDRISSELIKAHQRGIAVRVISDADKSQDLGSDLDRFAAVGIPVRFGPGPSRMHHKFAVFDGRVLANGSFNWTRSASLNNQENLVVMADPAIVASFAREFARLWETCICACRPMETPAGRCRYGDPQESAED